MDELITWLKAQIDADERAALAANVKQNDPVWKAWPRVGSTPRYFTVRSSEAMRPIAVVQDLAGDDETDTVGILDGEAAAEHIARHDPGRVLRDVKVKRQIIDACDRILCLEHPDGYEADILAESTLRLLAAGYDTEPGYQEAWRP